MALTKSQIILTADRAVAAAKAEVDKWYGKAQQLDKQVARLEVKTEQLQDRLSKAYDDLRQIKTVWISSHSPQAIFDFIDSAIGDPMKLTPFEIGYAARRSGVALEDNPYDPDAAPWSYKKWAAGWKA